MFGHNAAELPGKPIEVLIPESHALNHQNYIKKYKETGESKIIGTGREATGIRKNESALKEKIKEYFKK